MGFSTRFHVKQEMWPTGSSPQSYGPMEPEASGVKSHVLLGKFGT